MLRDPMVSEMFEVMHERFPKFNQQKGKEFIKRSPETLIHGDSHSGNIMIGRMDSEGIISELCNSRLMIQLLVYSHKNSGEVALLDFQTYGSGLVSVEFLNLLYNSYNAQSYEEVEDLAKGNNLTDYFSLPFLQSHFHSRISSSLM